MFNTNYLLHVYHQLPLHVYHQLPPTCLSPITSMFITNYLLHVYHQLPPCLSPITSYMFNTNYPLHVYHQLPPTCLSPITSYMFITNYLLHVYHQLPPTCLSPITFTCFGVCYTIFTETITLFRKQPYTFCNVAILWTNVMLFCVWSLFIARHDKRKHNVVGKRSTFNVNR